MNEQRTDRWKLVEITLFSFLFFCFIIIASQDLFLPYPIIFYRWFFIDDQFTLLILPQLSETVKMCDLCRLILLLTVP